MVPTYPPTKRRQVKPSAMKSALTAVGVKKKDRVMAAQNAKKALLTRGLVKGGNPDHSDSEEDDDDENEDVDAYTQAEVDTIGLVIMPEKRVKALEAMEKLVVGDQYGDSFMMFNTSFSYEVIHAFGQFKKRLQKGKTWADKFDLLFGFTMAIDKYDVWMNDHEMGWRQEGGDAMLRFLASKWKAALKQGDAELGIDSDFTRPGVIAMLEQFKKNLRRPEDYQGDGGMKFNYK
mmetsp:Transcript_33500/g.52734  ORF Transcript_33500/g.52734 Transcript_33500/m.52734 type:complete len:233 (-) Transcript_33500:271-969(-)